MASLTSFQAIIDDLDSEKEENNLGHEMNWTRDQDSTINSSGHLTPKSKLFQILNIPHSFEDGFIAETS